MTKESGELATCGAVLEDICVLISGFQMVEFQHVPRNCNAVADALAKKASWVLGLQVWLEDIPRHCPSCVKGCPLICIGCFLFFLNKVPGFWSGFSIKEKKKKKRWTYPWVISSITKLTYPWFFFFLEFQHMMFVDDNYFIIILKHQ